MSRNYLSRAKSGYAGINALLAVLLPSLKSAAPVNAVVATLTTALAGTNNDLVFTATLKGVYGNGITISYVNPGVETATESVAVVGKAITVTLRSVSTVLSTAAQVKTAIDGNAAAAALVTVANAGGNNGTGAVIALAATPLASGVNGTPGKAFEQRWYNGVLYINASDDDKGLATDAWYSQTFTIVS
jgi:hypothetical protein